MKKSKIIVPALGLLLLSTAASVSGTVAWFTANRIYGFTAGEFAVVNTKDNLYCELGEGIGTDVADNAVAAETGLKLTDASFDHTDTTLPIIAPNLEGDKVGTKTALTSATISNLERATDTYSAFTWTATFSVQFSATAEEDVGLFFDVAAEDTYANGMYKAGDGTGLLAVGDSVTGYTTDPKGKTAATGTAAADTKYYKAPVSTGKGYRVAIVPSTIPANSLGLTKVWAPNQTTAKSTFVDGVAVDGLLDPSKNAAAATAYSATSTQLVNGDLDDIAASTSTASALIDSGDTALTVPTSETSKTAALGMKNFLGYFKATPNSTVSLTFTFVAWYEGSDENIVNTASTKYETMAIGMQFGVYNLAD